MNMHNENPIEYSAEKISIQYKLDKQIIGKYIINI